ncbi:MAG: PIG-L family deacetylase [Thermomicrobium sp.]|nr:PIG-L family deacetylase [Thermomicrobium sp.]MDW7982205.1 PIG-L deacetylase family protein [Thermomicrobium sp.]
MGDERRVLVVVAHPDDMEIGCGGTVARWVDEGWTVALVVVTDGGGGGPDDAEDVSPEARRRISEIRKAEQHEGARILGVQSVAFLDYPDGRLEPTLDLRRDLVRVIRHFRPQILVIPSPDRNWSPGYQVGRYHPDHLAVGQAALAAVYPAAGNAWDFPELLAEGLRPHHVQEIWVINAPVLNHAVDITTTIERKLEALKAHRSQFGERLALLERWIRQAAMERGVRHGMHFAEEFHRIRVREPFPFRR